MNHKQQPKNFFKIPGSPVDDHVTLTKETRMPLEVLTSPRFGHKRASFPHPVEHVAMTENWREKHSVTVSNFNGVHHKSQREYFDRPIAVPDKGYSHTRRAKAEPMTVYASKTPMRSVKHC